jgi:hypothetical protein
LTRHRLLQVVADAGGPAPLYSRREAGRAGGAVSLGTGIDARLQSLGRLETGLQPFDVPQSDADRALARALAARSRPHFYLEGPPTGEKEAAARWLAASLNAPLLVVDLGKLLTATGDRCHIRRLAATPVC